MNRVETIIAEKMDALKSSGAYRYFLEVNKSAQHFPTFHFTDESGTLRSAVNWCSNDYLCMSTREEVIAKLGFVAHRSGTASSGTRNISGTTNYHRELEKLLAQWHQKEAALVFNGAYQANVTALQTIGRHIPGLIFISDARNHASLIEGMRAAGNRKEIFPHNDMAALEQILNRLPMHLPKMIVFESVYSIKGTVAPVAEIIAIAKKYDALTYIDEVHAVGLYGPSGAGMLEQLGLQQDVDFINGTLSKAIGVFGGYLATSALFADFIRSFGPGFIFTTSLPPAICAAAHKSISLVREEDEARLAVHKNVAALRGLLRQQGIEFSGTDSHITSVHIGDAERCRVVAARLLQEYGLYLQPINHPTVPRGEECLRIITTARHLPRHINHLVYSLTRILNEKHPHHRSKLEAVAVANGDCAKES